MGSQITYPHHQLLGHRQLGFLLETGPEAVDEVVRPAGGPRECGRHPGPDLLCVVGEPGQQRLDGPLPGRGPGGGSGEPPPAEPRIRFGGTGVVPGPGQIGEHLQGLRAHLHGRIPDGLDEERKHLERREAHPTSVAAACGAQVGAGVVGGIPVG
ncbi:hypothetical protein ACWF9X_22785 [Streptomyces globisporus]